MNSLNDVLRDRSFYPQKPVGINKNKPEQNDYFQSVKGPVFSIEDKVIEKKGVVDYVEMAKKRFDNQRIVAVNNLDYMVNGELVLPEEITSLIDNPVYLPRYKKLAKIHGVKYLLKLAELARLSNHYKPSRWFAKCCAVKEWQDKTLEMLNKLFKKIQQTTEKLRGIPIDKNYFYYYIKAVGELSEGQVNKILELSKARWVDKPHFMLAKATKTALAGKPWS